MPTGYAYLIRSSVRMPELYPLIGEILFPTLLAKDARSVPHVVGMFIDDSPENMLRIISKPREVSGLKSVCREFVKDVQGQVCLPRVACWMDTAGKFYDRADQLVSLPDDSKKRGRRLGR